MLRTRDHAPRASLWRRQTACLVAAERWATALADRHPGPGEPGLRLRCYLDVRQNLNS
ncbi:DUF6207 family protein [Streptomyces purpurascens]|uniref:DUF6207 family protein n=1 Tax=Streptomyces purpurascens TaxID=1924 RepID=UPI00340CF3C8